MIIFHIDILSIVNP